MTTAPKLPEGLEPVAWRVDWTKDSMVDIAPERFYDASDAHRMNCHLSYVQGVGPVPEPLYTATQMREAILAATERAAKVCDEKAAKSAKLFGSVIHDMTVANQAAWIEWKHGKGAEAAMTWVHNGLAGPGLIPEDDAPYATEPQAWYDANNADPFPTCFCGRPSNIGWMKQGFCCHAHYETGVAAASTGRGEGGEGA